MTPRLLLSLVDQVSNSATLPYPSRQAPAVWPGILVLTGAVICLIGLFFLLPRQPKRVAQGGYAQFEPNIRKLADSRREYSSLIVSARNGNEAILIISRYGNVEINLSVDATHPERETEIRAFFRRGGIEPCEEYTTPADEFNSEMTHLTFQLHGDPSEMAEVSISIFRDIIGITNDEEMVFSFEP